MFPRNADGSPPVYLFRPEAGSRDGWYYKTYKRIGRCFSSDQKQDGSVRIYGIYGVTTEQLFVQYEGQLLPGGIIQGVSLLSSSADMEVYFWCGMEHFDNVEIFC